jgi:hypothetical protein
VKTGVCDLDISVVLTFMDDRGQTEECVSSWTRGQTLPRDRYEVIFVASGREPAVEAVARPLLHANDRLVTHRGSNELTLHDFGARQARGKWLLFTEAHCAAQPECLAELVGHLQAHEGRYVGACIRTLSDRSSNALAQLEDRWYREGFESWSSEGDWRKVTIRGTALRRDVYKKSGGFRSEFGCFAECLLAAELDLGGYRLGFAPTAAVKHYNSTSLRELLAYVREFREGEVAFQSLEGSERFAGYFGWESDWSSASAADNRLASRCAARSLRRAIAGARRQGAAAMTRSMLGFYLRAMLDVASLGRARLLRAAALYGLARARFAMPSMGREDRYEHYYALWEAAGNLARQRALSRQARHRARPCSVATVEQLDYCPGEMQPSSLVGFHGREHFEGQSFRWSSPLALVRVSVSAGDYEVRLDTKDIGGSQPPGFIDLYLNGHRLPRADTSIAGCRSFFATGAMFRDGVLQDLVLTSGRLRSVSRREQRILGVPVFSIKFIKRETCGDRSTP